MGTSRPDIKSTTSAKNTKFLPHENIVKVYIKPWSNWRSKASSFDAFVHILSGEHDMTNLAGRGGYIPDALFGLYITKCDIFVIDAIQHSLEF